MVQFRLRLLYSKYNIIVTCFLHLPTSSLSLTFINMKMSKVFYLYIKGFVFLNYHFLFVWKFRILKLSCAFRYTNLMTRWIYQFAVILTCLLIFTQRTATTDCHPSTNVVVFLLLMLVIYLSLKCELSRAFIICCHWKFTHASSLTLFTYLSQQLDCKDTIHLCYQ